MANEKRIVAIDADFFNKLTEKEGNGDLFLRIMDEMNTSPVMHEYVASYELSANSVARTLIANGDIKVYTYADYIDSAERNSYEELFKRAYIDLNFKSFPQKTDVFSYHHCQENLGEIRTALMALYMGIGLFMSDDGGAKKFVETKLSSRRRKITVYNIFDTLVEIHRLGTGNIRWDDVKGMAKYVFGKKSDKFNKINNIWHM